MSKQGLKKSRTFSSKQSPPMAFTTLANPKQGEKLVHFSHPQHSLQQVIIPYLFTCMGCKEYGAGGRFRCETCDFNLHDFCALAPPSIQTHPLHSQHQLIFYTKPGGFLASKCEICSKTTKGYAFRCSTCNFGVHPCCTLLQQQMDFPTHPHTLFLSPPTATPNGNAAFVCGECKRKRSGKIYHCPICSYHLHAVCAKDMVNGLYVYGLSAPEKSTMLATAAKAASTAFSGFIGGIIEGIGEGIGEVIIQNIAKGNPTSVETRSAEEMISKQKAIAHKEA